MTDSDTHRTRPAPLLGDVAGSSGSALDVREDSPATGPRRPIPGQGRRPSGRVSFSTALHHKPSFVSRWKNAANDEETGSISSPKPAIPSALQPTPEVYTTPLPTLSMVVLSIVSDQVRCPINSLFDVFVDNARRIPLCQCLCAVLTVHGRRYSPFNGSSLVLRDIIPFFQAFINLRTKLTSDIGPEFSVRALTLVIILALMAMTVSTFFLTQFLTSLLWVRNQLWLGIFLS